MCDSKGSGESARKGEQGHSRSDQLRREGAEKNLQVGLDSHGIASNEQSDDRLDNKSEEKKVEGVSCDDGRPCWGWSCIKGPLVTSECELQNLFEPNTSGGRRPQRPFRQRRTRIADKGCQGKQEVAKAQEDA